MLQVRERIYGLKVRHLYKNLPEVTIASLTLPLAICLSIQTREILIWSATYFIVNLATLSRTWKMKKKLFTEAEVLELDPFVRQWKIQTYFLGILWMLTPWIIDINDPISFILFGFMISGVTVGVTVSCATFPKISFIYCSMILGSLFIYLVSRMDIHYWSIAGVTIIFYILILKMQKTLSSFINDAFSLTVELENAKEKIQRSSDAIVVSSRLAAQAEMTASLAHEINNPLTVIQFKATHLQVALEKGRLLDSDVLIASKKILDMVSRIKDIIQSTKNYFYDENEGPELVRVELGEVIQEISEIFKQKCQSLNIAFSCTDVAGLEVRGVKRSISQIVTNMLNNAFDSVKSNAMGGKIDLKIEDDQDSVLIKVVDSGQGVSEGLSEKIFEPFYTTKGKGAGLGIGLSICLALVKQMEGNLWLEPGLPTTFSLRLKKTS